MRDGNIVSCPRNKHMFRCDQNGPPARRSEPDWRKEGAYLNGYVTDEQRSRRPIFIATLWAVASWLFFRVARSLRIDSRYARRNRQSGSDRLEKQPTDLRRNICLFRGQDTGSTSYFGDRTQALLTYSSSLPLANREQWKGERIWKN